MKLRVKYRVTEAGRFLGHLDLTRTIMKILRRAQIPVMLSEGFNPHPKLSFAMPLSLGHTAEGEYFEVVLTETMAEDEFTDRLNQCSPEAIIVTEVKEIKEKQESMSSQINCAIYHVSFTADAEKEILQQVITDILESDTIIIEKKSKRNIKEANIRPLIFDLRLLEERPNDCFVLEAVIAHGSTENLKISDLLTLFQTNIQQNIFADALITRVGLYVKEGNAIRTLMDF